MYPRHGVIINQGSLCMYSLLTGRCDVGDGPRMLTVEELVIESLYHRLVLVNVKKQLPGPSHTPGDGTNIDDEIDESVDDVVEGAAGGDAGGGGDAAGGGGDAASGSTSRSATGGLGNFRKFANNKVFRAWGTVVMHCPGGRTVIKLPPFCFPLAHVNQHVKYSM